MPIDVRRSWSRFVTQAEGRRTAHSFSFGEHYDPANLGFGALIAHNDEVLQPGAGYASHPHADTEIITLVVKGGLHHVDDLGNERVLTPGQVQLLSAGKGVVHSEMNGVDSETRFIQMWVRPDHADLVPTCTVTDLEFSDDWTQLAGPDGLPLRAAGTSLYVARLGSRSRLALPDALHLHVFVIDGAAGLGERELTAGSAARLRDQGGRTITGDADDTLVLVCAQSDAAYCK